MGNVFTDSTLINYYEILDVSPKASAAEIYQAYLRMKKAYSLRNPELFRSFSLDEIQQLLLYIEEAYATIGNSQSRQLYDSRFFTLPSAQDLPAEELDANFAEEIESIPALPVVAVSAPVPSTTQQTPVPLSALPQGYASTSTTIYEVDPTFEALVEGQQFFDGIFLSKVRKYKKVKLEDFSQQTCISIRYLYAIENNNYNALPAPVFVRGYIHQYCKTLNLDAEKVIPSFMKLYANGRE